MLIDCLFILRDADSNTVPFHQILLQDSSSFAEVKSEAAKGLDLKDLEIFYTDDEGDTIRVCTDDEMAEAFSVSRPDNAITFYVDAKKVADIPKPSPELCELPASEPVEQPQVEQPPVEESKEVESAPEVEADQNCPFVEHADIHLKFDGSSLKALQDFLNGKCTGENPFEAAARECGEEERALLQEHLRNGLPMEMRECWIETGVSEQPQESEVKESEAKESKPVVHRHVLCDACNKTVVGIRYKCYNCADYDLCEACEETNLSLGTHDPTHIFLKIYKPTSMPYTPAENVYERRSGCPYKNKWAGKGKCHRGGRFKKRREEVDAKIASLETMCTTLAEQVAELTASRAQPREVVEEQPVESNVPEAEEAQEVHVEAEPQEEEEAQELVFEQEVAPVAENVASAASEPSLLEQSMAGLAPEAMVAFECLVNMGFNDYPLIATLLRQHKGNVQNVVAELLSAK